MIFKWFITSEGWLAKPWERVLSFGGLAVVVIPWFLEISIGYCLILTIVGSVISLIGSYAAKARQFGFQAPFTNDPFGWRKAKKSYEKKDLGN